MRVDVVFDGQPLSIKVPQVCCMCAKAPPYEYVEVKASDTIGPLVDKWVTLISRFPYCVACSAGLKGKLLFKEKAKGVSVYKSWVRTEKIGQFLRKKKIKYIPFEFKNEEYGRLFKEANKERLLEKALAELK